METINEGDIVFARFTPPGQPNEYKVRPVLVIDVTPFGITVVYGSSKHTAEPLPWEFVVGDDEAAKVFLPRATRFDFRKREKLPPVLEDRRIWAHMGHVGNIRSLSKETKMHIFEAFRASGLAD